MNRQELRMYVYQLHSVYQPVWRKKAPLCPWCEHPLDREFDLHEFLVKRSAVPKDKQHLIMVPSNTAPVHHECHMRYGQTKEMAFKCLHRTCTVLNPRTLGQWYVGLWQDHGLSIPRGNLIERSDCTFDMAKQFISQELAHLSQAEPDSWETATGEDARYLIYRLWAAGSLRDGQFRGEIAGVGLLWVTVIGALVQGYWRHYLEGIVG